MILLFACRLFYRVNSNSSFCSNYGVTGYGVNSNNFFNSTTVSTAVESAFSVVWPLPQEKRETLITTASDKNNFFIFVCDLD